MEEMTLSWELFAAPYVVLALFALVRVFTCKDVFETFPWEIRTDKPQGRKACILLLAMTVVVALAVMVLSGMCFYAIGGLGFAIMVVLIEGYIFLLTGLAFVYLAQGIFGFICSLFYLLYMMGCYFFRK